MHPTPMQYSFFCDAVDSAITAVAASKVPARRVPSFANEGVKDFVADNNHPIPSVTRLQPASGQRRNHRVESVLGASVCRARYRI